MENVELLTVDEAAKVFRVQSSTLRTWIYRKQVPSTILFRIGNTVRVRKKQLDEFINSEGSDGGENPL